jgi:hypothetical protein
MDGIREVVEIIQHNRNEDIIGRSLRVDTYFILKINPNSMFENDKYQVEKIFEWIIKAFLSPYNDYDEYAITLSSPNLDYKCMLPLIRKYRSIDDIIFSMQLYCYTAPNHYRDIFKLKLQVFPQNDYSVGESSHSESSEN